MNVSSMLRYGIMYHQGEGQPQPAGLTSAQGKASGPTGEGKEPCTMAAAGQETGLTSSMSPTFMSPMCLDILPVGYTWGSGVSKLGLGLG